MLDRATVTVFTTIIVNVDLLPFYALPTLIWHDRGILYYFLILMTVFVEKVIRYILPFLAQDVIYTS